MTITLPLYGAGVGYGMILGLGALFAIGMSVISVLLSRFMAERQSSEMFSTAKHTIKTGLISSAVVSSWTIAATLLSSTTEGYLYGVSGPFWYGAGACVQILLFAVAAIELKRKAPQAHTFLEVVRCRYGTAAHWVFMCYSLFYQVITTVNLLVGGSTIFATLTGVNEDAACLLLPIGVVVYTCFGGIKATFLTDWLHTVIIYVIMLLCLFVAYVTSDVVGSPARMYELLQEAAALHPVSGNAEGSYLTMRSEGGGYIGLIFLGAGFAAAVDSQLFQKAIAADPASTFPGYIIGGLAWFSVPFCLASTFGLAAAGLEHLPSFPTYPNRMSDSEVSGGLAMPFAAIALMGKGGGIAVLLMVFMAVTSAMSSETVATSSVVTYDIYKTYVKPDAGSDRLLRVSHLTVVGFAILTACIAIGFNHAGFSVNYLVTAIGIFVDSAIVPMACTIMWKKQSRMAVIFSPLISSAAAIVAWLLTAYTHYGSLSITTTSEDLPLVAGNMMSLCGPIVLTPLITFLKPDDFDWGKLKMLRQDQVPGPTLDNEAVLIGQQPEAVTIAQTGLDSKDGDMSVPEKTALPDNGSPDRRSSVNHELEVQSIDFGGMDEYLRKARNKAMVVAGFLCLALLILWPIPMYGSSYVFSIDFFKGWVVVLFLFAFSAASTITVLPLVQGRRSMVRFFKAMLR